MENDDSIDKISAAQPLPALSKPVLWGLVAAKLLLHLPGLFRYGYFRDELYFLDCARHLDWGYVDCAPSDTLDVGTRKFLGQPADLAPVVCRIARTHLWVGRAGRGPSSPMGNGQGEPADLPLQVSQPAVG